MLNVRPPALNRSAQEGGAPIVLVLPDSDDRPLLRTAMAFAHGAARPLRAFCIQEPGADLPLPLRVSLYGLASRSEADRAIRHLIQSASAGAAVNIRPLPEDLDEGDPARELGVVPGSPSSLLVLGWLKGSAPPPVERMQAVARHCRGPAMLLLDQVGPAFREVLAIDSAGEGSQNRGTLREIAPMLERCYPVWRREAFDLKTVQAVLKDTRRDGLLVVSLPDDGGLGPFEAWGDDPAAMAPGPLAVLLPPHGDARTAALDRLLGG